MNEYKAGLKGKKPNTVEAFMAGFDAGVEWQVEQETLGEPAEDEEEDNGDESDDDEEVE